MIGSAQSAPQQQMPQQGMPAEQASMMGGEQPIEEDNQFMKGKNPDRSRPLMSAIQQLENYVRESTNRDEILTARGVIKLLTELIARGQDSMMQE